jgi:drug/metabolite transporter (DMT)-like permease
VSVRRLGRTEHPVIIVFYFTLITVPASLPGMLADAVMPTPAELGLLVGVGVTAVLGQLYMTRGLQREPAGRATAISYVQVVFAALWGVLWFHEYPDALGLAGAALVLFSALVLARRRRDPSARIQRPEESTADAV